ncbi:hypothetical protein RHGRI_004531 [Rhododendron griersonianum]|uniref:Fungal lipase-like domain-containing protein n=1 Tax=Rhododendron griersonianum TaxID=479676 RepID=A0AAV6LBP5_9ERIC|nr:hypothetical protein RHGRI_004531 [Rhododendron griersonianum]
MLPGLGDMCSHLVQAGQAALKAYDKAAKVSAERERYRTDRDNFRAKFKISETQLQETDAEGSPKQVPIQVVLFQPTTPEKRPGGGGDGGVSLGGGDFGQVSGQKFHTQRFRSICELSAGRQKKKKGQGSLGAILLLIIMATQYRSFNLSGPLYLTAVDWRNPHHRRSAAASLVQGVYSQEHDRQGHQALAPPWSDFFNFRLFRVMVDNDDGSIFGAIYEFKSPPPNGQHNPLHIPPRYVVAFRGTMTGWETMKQDLTLDLRVIRNTLEQTARFQLAMQAVQDTVSIAGAANMCLAGHSLGSAMALLAGKNMAKMGYFLETYLFNPPFISIPIEVMTKTEILKRGIRIMGSVTTAGVTISLNALRRRPQTGDWFAALSRWIPYLFVNPSDPISAEYVGYFGHREWMEENGVLGAIERVSARNSISGAIEPLHLLPSAYLTINGSPVQGLGQAHGLDQWWELNIQCRSRLHRLIDN